MKRLFSFFLLTTLSLFLSACYRNPVTGRNSLNLVDEGTMRQLASQQYTGFLATNVAVTGSGDAATVKRVGQLVANAVERYLRSKGQADVIAGYQWEFNLVNKNEANAWCMPGGKVVVYSGIMTLVKNDAGLAVVLGHEIAHAIARHGNERMSQQMATQGAGEVLSVAVANKPEVTQNVFKSVYGISSTLGTLTYSRKHESEADHMGLIFMAMAGYDPNEAVGFWQRMEAQSKQKPPEFLSTHPSDARRIDQIKGWMPEAMNYYKLR